MFENLPYTPKVKFTEYLGQTSLFSHAYFGAYSNATHNFQTHVKSAVYGAALASLISSASMHPTGTMLAF